MQFATAGRVVFEQGSARKLASHAADLGITRALVVTDQGIVGAGLLAPVAEGLEGAGVAVSIYDDVIADPPVSTIMAAREQALAFKADGVIGLGGGSSLDAAKLAALLAKSDEQLDDIYGVGMAKGPRLPLILVPTTAGTGSEVTPISIVTVGDEEKKGVVAPVLLPDIALLDPELTIGLPPAVTAATGIDAMVHAIEAYTSVHQKNPISDSLATRALQLLASGLPKAYTHGADIDARSDVLLGACLAGMAFANAPVAAVHALAYPIGARFHVAHGVSNALMLPHVLRFNVPEAAELYAELAPIICSADEIASAQTPADAFVTKMERMCNEMSVPRRLVDVGIGEDDLDQLADDAMLQTRLLINNPREVSRADALALYQRAL